MICIDPDLSVFRAWESIRAFLNSAFVSAFLSALAGAGLGVWGAQRLAQQSIRRKELLDALRQANGLVVLASTISNQALALKKQHVLPLSQTYFEDRKAAEAANEIVLSDGVLKGGARFKAEMVHITPLTVPVEALKSLTYSAQLMPGRALALVAMVEQSLTEFAHALRVRSEQIELLKGSDLSQEIFLQSYFGLKRRDGNVDSLYHDSMVAIQHYIDDVAFFSSELADEIQAHAVRIRQRLVKLMKEVPKASAVDFSGARNSGLMPPRENYSSWLSGFRTPG